MLIPSSALQSIYSKNIATFFNDYDYLVVSTNDYVVDVSGHTGL